MDKLTFLGIQENETVKQLVKIAVAGPGDGGKTELFYRFAGRDFSGHAPVTIGTDFRVRKIKQTGKEITVQIWDTAGHERFNSTNEPMIKAADGIVFVFDITNKQNFEDTKDRIEFLKQKLKLDNCDMILVGNKCDREDRREVSKVRGIQLAAKHKMKFFEVSAKTNARVEEAFQTLLRDTIGRKDGVKSAIPEEIEQDPYAVLLYEKALQAGKEKDKSIRVNIVGNFRQGKTTLMRRLLGQEVNDVTSTNGIIVEHYKCEKTKDGKLQYTKTDNTDKSDYVRRLVTVAKREDVLDEDQVTKSTKEPNVLQEKDEKVSDVLPISEVVEDATQSVLSSRSEPVDKVLNKVSVLSPEEKGLFAQTLKSSQTSSQNEKQTVFDIWDFGGQYIFYATHTLFHSKRAIYLLVFDISKDLNQCIIDEEFPVEMEGRNMRYFIQFWMSSIHSFVGNADGSIPKVILVGTHKDKVQGKKPEREEYIKNYLKEVRQIFDGTGMSLHIHFNDFAVDNTDEKDPSLNSLRETIIRIGDEQSETYEIPLKWIQLEKSMLERKHLKLISVRFVLALDLENEFPLGDKEQVKLFLRYHHAKGTFIYFDEEPISEYVVLDPQYLIDAFKCIITSERFCTNDPEIRPLWKMLLTEGRLEKQLIERQWGKPEEKFEMFAENKEILLSFLVKHHIISEAAVFDENTQQSTGLGWYVVPSLLREHSARTEFTEFLDGKQLTKLRYVLLFDIPQIVPTVYHRLASAAIGMWPIAKYGKKTLIFKDRCVVRLNIDHAGILQMTYDSIEMSVVSLCPTTDVNREQADRFRRFLEAVLANEFQKLRLTDETYTKPHNVQFRCSHVQHGVDGSENLISLNDMNCRKVVPCPDLMSHDINVENARGEWFQDNRKITSIPDKQLTEKLLGRISQCIGENWELLGLELGLSQVQIDHICEENVRAVMRRYAMLHSWYRDDVDTSTLKVLVDAVQRCPRMRIDWDGLRNIIDELN